MAINNVSNMINNKFRLTGLSSGLDTDTLIKDMMKVERIPLDKIMQKKQLAEWKRDSYRDITNLIRELKDGFFDVLKPSNYMLSQSTYKKFTTSTTDATVVTATGGAEATAGTHKITVSKLAQAGQLASADTITKALESESTVTTGLNSDVVNASGKKIKVTLDGMTKEITMGTYTQATTLADFAADLQNRIGVEFGAGKVSVNVTGSGNDRVTFTTTGGASKLTFENAGSNNGLGFLHISNATTNRLSTTDTLSTISAKLKSPFSFKPGNGTENIALTINSQSFTFSKDTTLSSMMNTINSSSTANVNMAYDEVSDKFIITSKQAGSGNNIQISEDTSTFLASTNFKGFTGSQAAALTYTNEKFYVSIDGDMKEFTLNGVYANHADLALDIQNMVRNEFAGKMVTVTAGTDNKLGFSLDNTGSTLVVGTQNTDTSALGFGNANYNTGEDAQFILDGQSVTRSSNTFTANGVNYTLLKESNTEQTVTLNLDVNTIYSNIKNFVDKYNDVIQKINGKLSEKYDRDYLPLTDEQKEAMSEDNVKKWEEKAKTGMLRNDSILQNVVNNMRKAMYDGIDSLSKGLSSIGINTGTYSEKGKLVIDENKLRAAIQNDPDGVMNIFSKKSSTVPSYSRNLTASQKTSRYNEEGIANRLSDIIEDNISSFRDAGGRKGILLQTAGIEGDISEYSNTIYNEITGYNSKITDLTEALSKKEDRYYQKFAQLEKLMGQMNQQSSWLSSQLGQNQ